MAAISKAEYLKRYLSKDELPKEEKKKKKRRIKPSKDSKLKIIDDDVDFKKLKPDEIVEDDDEAPMVAEIIDERPKHIQQLEAYRKTSRWKVLGENEEDEISALEYGVINQSPSHKQKDMLNNKKRRRHDSSDSDTSPPRRNQDSGGKASSSKTNLKKSNKPQRHDSDSDASLPRKGKNYSDRPLQAKAGRAQSSSPDNSPPRAHKTSRARHDSDSDVSPPRKSSKVTDKNESHIDLDPSPPRKGRARHDSDSDPSPPRKRQPTSDSDQSPPRKMKAGSDSDASPPRKRRHDSDSDQSPPRKSQGSSKGAEDSRHRSRTSPSSSSKSSKSSRKSRFDSESREDGGRKATKTLAGAKAGLSSAKEMKEEAKKLRAKEDRSFQNLDETTLGKNARTVVRDKETGKKRDLKAEEEKSEEQRRKEEEQQKKYQQWGKGLKQQAMVDARLQDQVHEASKPLARYGDDKDLDQMLRNEEREEDPMLAFIRSKKKKEEEKSGKKKKELPKYKGTAPPPNRFNIMPGYRWDGVDRSNGFEKKIFASQANKKAIQEIAYKWSTEDM